MQLEKFESMTVKQFIQYVTSVNVYVDGGEFIHLHLYGSTNNDENFRLCVVKHEDKAGVVLQKIEDDVEEVFYNETVTFDYY